MSFPIMEDIVEILNYLQLWVIEGCYRIGKQLFSLKERPREITWLIKTWFASNECTDQ